MSDAQPTPTAPPLAGARGAWLATALGIPLYGLSALALALAAAPLVSELAPERTTFEDLALFVSVALLNVLIALIAVPLIAHTLGRAVYVRTASRPVASASLTFAAMGVLLAVPVVVFVSVGQPLLLAGSVYAVLAIAAPCALTAGLTRAVLPRVAASPTLTRVVVAIGVAGVFAVVVWTAVVLFGA